MTVDLGSIFSADHSIEIINITTPIQINYTAGVEASYIVRNGLLHGNGGPVF